MPTLYVVATPIGNLEDLTIRAINVLSNVDFILAEDTRVTRILLERYNIQKEIISYHQHSTIHKLEFIIDLLYKGKNLALVSDAGTPSINDPGGYLVQEVLKSLPETKVIPIPGANAAVTALSVSSFPADNFVFLGFPPHKKGRQTFFKILGTYKQTIVFYESKHRIMKTLDALKLAVKDRPLMVARELTKQFETLYRGTAEEIVTKLTKDKILGEFVIVVAPLRQSHSEASP